MKTVIIDNYDSFTYNLYQYLGELDERPTVFRNDAVTLEEVRRLNPERIVISPGPGNPEDPAYFGVCRQVILELGKTIPTLGVCLGHQGICSAFGGRIVRAPEVMHGKTSPISHDNSDLFTGLPEPFEAMRYHSLVAEPESLPACLKVTARSLDGIIMGVQHTEYPIYGVQFHPESIGTPGGRRLIENFIFLGR
ncbi:MAG: Para-aminobenzoate/anthranilate synthase glutamine amidotransferasecomponent [Labilithrix sp.]|nr:Para-aminobenzoate/anthranilate synthase glutamine amidotransferasecomponent [Labilithrix sp.]